MLQKLYQHLEQINANTRQQHTDLAHAEEWAEKISQQLDELNLTIRSLEPKLQPTPQEPREFDQPRQPPPSRRSFHPLLPAGMAVITAILLAILWTNMQGMSAAMHGISAAAASGRESSKAALEAYGVVNTRTEQVAEKSVRLEAKTTQLDSIVTQQAQTIEELKKLNVSAVRTVFYLQRELARQHRQDAAQALAR